MCNLIAIIVPVISGARLLKCRRFCVRMQRTRFGFRRPVAATAADFRFYFMLVALERVVLVVVHLVVVESPIVP